jgi:hypothetical protein
MKENKNISAKDYSEYSADELVTALETAGRTPPLALIRACLARQEELSPRLLALFQESLYDQWPDDDDPRWYRFIHAGYFMLAFREEAALPIFEEVYREGEDMVEWFEIAPAIYGATAIPFFRRVLQMDTKGEYHYGRNMSAELLYNLARQHPETREEVIAALRSVLPPLTSNGDLDIPPNHYEDIWGTALSYLSLLRDEDSKPQAKALFAAELIDPFVLPEEEYWDAFAPERPYDFRQKPFDIIENYEFLLAQAEREHLLAEQNRLQAELEARQAEHKELLRQIDVNTTEIRQLSKKAGKKIGRNDPCPCGSGKKYKKCHGRPGA